MPSNPSSGAASAGNPAEGVEKPKRWSKPLEYALTRALIRTLNLVGSVTPPSALAPMGRALGTACFYTMRRYRRVALDNLHRAYGGEWDEEKIRRTAVESFRNLGITMVEFFLRQPRLTLEMAGREIGFEGQEYWEEARARGKGTLLITAHYGNWEIMGPRLVHAGYRISAISRTADDPGLESMIEGIRTRAGYTQIPRKQAARQGLAVLRKNEVLAILLDQNTLEGGIFVPFFGYPASTATGPAVFALKTGAALLPTFCVRGPDGRHTLRTWPPIYPESTGDRARDIERLTAEVTRVIEQQIREQPELWCWLHNRWKLQPSAPAVSSDASPTEMPRPADRPRAQAG